MTVRDEIWKEAMLRAGMKGEEFDRGFDREEIEEATGAGKRTVRDCLDKIAKTPFLDKSIRDGRVFYVPGVGFDQD